MQATELAKLRDSIARNGLRHPITLHPDGRLLDGQNRYECCLELGVEPETEVYQGRLDVASLIEFVKDKNENRRQLTFQQSVDVGVKLANLSAGSSSGTQGGGVVTDGNDVFSQEKTSAPAVTQQAAADAVGVSKNSISQGKVVHDRQPKIYESFTQGTISLKDAYELAKRGNEDLAEQASHGTAEDAKAAVKEAREREKQAAEERKRQKERDALAEQRRQLREEERRLLDEQVPPADRDAYREQLAKKPSERDHTATIIPLPNITDEEAAEQEEIAHAAIFTGLLEALSRSTATLQYIIENSLRTEMLDAGQREILRNRLSLHRVQVDYLEAVANDAAADDSWRV